MGVRNGRMGATYESESIGGGCHVLDHLFFQRGESVVCSVSHLRFILWVFPELGGELEVVDDAIVIGVHSSHDFVDFVV